MTTPPGLPDFATVDTPDGALSLSWTPPSASVARAALVVALRAPHTMEAASFWAGAHDADLIRVPVDALSGHATAYVPAGRPLYVALIVRDEHATATAIPVQRATAARPARALEAPVRHDHGPSPEAGTWPELVFVDDGAHPDLAALAARVAARAAGGPPPDSAPAPTPGAFGAQQRWYLTRLAWSPPEDGHQLLVRRERFISADDLRAWTGRGAPPNDAIPLPADCDGLVDALAPDDSTTFYAVLAGPVVLALAPDPPPFERSRRPLLLGSVAERLHAACVARLDQLERAPLRLAERGPVLELVTAAASVAPDPTLAARIAAARRARPF